MTLLCTLFSIACLSGSISGEARAVDGDTLAIGSTRVRLFGIDAEELDEPNGRPARATLAFLIGREVVTCQWQGRSYDRLVAVCYVPSSPDSLNAQMVTSGHALDCARYSHGLYAKLEPAGVRLKLKQKPYC